MSTPSANAITIGPRFFKQERNNYADWRAAIVREFLQNSVDAGATRIDIWIEEIKDKVKISVADNGRGMSLDVLKNVYLVAGNTSKENEGTVGGFGKARILTCWANDSYSIKSCNYLVTGSGSHYEIQENQDFCKGSIFETITDPAPWVSITKRVLAGGYKNNCSVYVNGELFDSYPNRGRFIREISSGLLYVNKTNKFNRLDVRVQGVWMYSINITAPVHVMLELNPDKAREILTSNRDGMKAEYSQEVASFLQELASESLSALKPRRPRRQLRMPGNGFKAVSENKQISTRGTKEVSVDSFVSGFKTGIGTPEIHEQFSVSTLVKQRHPILENSFFLNEAGNYPSIYKLEDKYRPDNIQEGTTRFKLLAIWFKICEIAMQKFVNQFGEFDGLSWGVGFILTEPETKAVHLTDNGVHYFLLNPVDLDGKIAYSVNDKENIGTLVAIAAHEISHVASSRHDEIFASVMTTIADKMFGEAKQVFAAVKKVKDGEI